MNAISHGFDFLILGYTLLFCMTSIFAVYMQRVYQLLEQKLINCTGYVLWHMLDVLGLYYDFHNAVLINCGSRITYLQP